MQHKIFKLTILGVLISCQLSAQSIISITPDSAFVGSNISTIISSKNTMFNPSSTNVYGVDLKQASTTINATSFFVPNDTTVNADFSIPMSVPIGYYDVNVHSTVYGTLTLSGGFFIFFPVSFEHFDINNSIKVFPNPAFNNIQVELPEFTTPTEISIINMVGETVYQKSINHLSGNNIYIDLPDITSGIYFIKIATNHHTFIKRCVIMK
ncbi:MAG: T9SS type A sorting domain-containing protein [Bacteroidetes bacterium]|nr:T9SS type A sorting domain-containing protein [Bacteroidota bacterium]